MNKNYDWLHWVTKILSVIFIALTLSSCDKRESNTTLALSDSDRLLVKLFVYGAGPEVSQLSPVALNKVFKLGGNGTDLQRQKTLKEIKGALIQWTLVVYEIKKVSENEASVITDSGVIDNRSGQEVFEDGLRSLNNLFRGGFLGAPKSPYDNQSVGTSILLSVNSPSEWEFLGTLRGGSKITIRGHIKGIQPITNFIEIDRATLATIKNEDQAHIIAYKAGLISVGNDSGVYVKSESESFTKKNGFALRVLSVRQPSDVTEGDLITEVNGKRLKGLKDWHEYTLLRDPLATQLEYSLVRAGEKIKVKQTVAKKFLPGNVCKPIGGSVYDPGLGADDLNDEAHRKNGQVLSKPKLDALQKNDYAPLEAKIKEVVTNQSGVFAHVDVERYRDGLEKDVYISKDGWVCATPELWARRERAKEALSKL